MVLSDPKILATQTPYSDSTWLLGDHLGSTSMTVNSDGTLLSEVRYSAFGEVRYQSGTTTTDYLFTGQRQEAEIGLYYYVARWYDPAIGRFVQADSVVPDPGSALGYDRYGYVNNSPIIHNDPTGHWLDTVIDIISIGSTVADISQNGLNWSNGLALAVDVACLALPVVSGGGALVRAASKVDDVVDVVKGTEKIVDVIDTAIDAANSTDEAVSAANEAVDLFRAIGDYRVNPSKGNWGIPRETFCFY